MDTYKKLTKLITNTHLTKEEKYSFFSLLFPKYFDCLNLTEQSIDNRFSLIQHHFTTFLTQFEQLAFPEGFGFDGFTYDDIWQYFLNDTKWTFDLNKVKGKGILYGTLHAEARRFLLNGLTNEEKLAVFRPKADYFNLFKKMSVLEGERARVSLQNVTDIGMGHSVYMLSFESENDVLKEVVVKQEEWMSQSFFSHILGVLGWPYYKSGHVIDHTGCWEISEYLGNVNLQDALYKYKNFDLNKLCFQLAKHAALGDIFGRGDRHFENYMVKNGDIYPIDISYLFWEGNEEWVEKYVAGGMYEVNVLSLYSDNSKHYEEALLNFNSTYKDTFQFISKNQETIYTEIRNYFGERDPDTQRKINFIQHRLESKTYINEQLHLYQNGLKEMKYRLSYKNKLKECVSKNPAVLNDYPELKMYYYADLNRMSCFYLSEEKKETLFKHIDSFS